MQLRKATRTKSKLRIGLSGPSGSGKTYSALKLASGLTDWDKVCIIDTENGSADLYDDLGEYNVITLQEPYSPERYIEAIESAEQAGMEVIIIDSVSHEWEGAGGCLEINEKIAQAKYRGNTWSAWNDTTKRHRHFIEKLISSSCHIIATTRSKTDTIMTEDKKIKKVGLKEIQREGFEYELTANFSIDRDSHFALSSKDRTGLFIDVDPFLVNKETGKILRDWSEKGVDTSKIVSDIIELMNDKGKDLQELLDAQKIDSLSKLSLEKLKKIQDRLEDLPDIETEKEPILEATEEYDHDLGKNVADDINI